MAAASPREVVAAKAAALAVAAKSPTAPAVGTVDVPVATVAAVAAPPRGGNRGGASRRDSYAAAAAATPDSRGENGAAPFRRCC